MARGTEENMVVFTSDSLTPSYADWHYLKLHKWSVSEFVAVEYGQIFTIEEHSSDTVRVSHCIVRHILSAGVGICAPATITYNFAYDCGHEGIDVSSRSGKPIIANNIVFHSSVGIFTHASPIIEYNTLIDNDRGLCLYAGDGIVRYNLITSPNGAPQDWNYGDFAYEAFVPHGRRQNTRGIEVRDSSPAITGNIICEHPRNIEAFGNTSPTITNNNIFKCEVGLFFNEFTGTPIVQRNNIYANNEFNIELRKTKALIDATNNWWETQDASKIEHKIWDYFDDTTLGKVNYEPFEGQIIKSSSVISFSLTKSMVAMGDSVKVLGFIGPPHEGVIVTLIYTKPNATTLTRTVTTNFAGSFSDSFMPDQVGSWSVKASWAGDGDHEAASSLSTSFRVEEVSALTTKELTPQPQATKPAVTPISTPEEGEPGFKYPIPGFDAIFAIADSLAVTYLMLRRRKA